MTECLELNSTGKAEGHLGCKLWSCADICNYLNLLIEPENLTMN